MKTYKMGFSIIGIISVAMLMSCSSPAKRVDKANENLSEAKEDYDQAQKDSAADYELFKKESEERIESNEKMIAAYKERIALNKEKFKAEDQKLIDELELKNIHMRKKIEEFKNHGKDEWVSFKSEFRHDMDELGKAIKDLSVKNTR
jgi:chromosome segregation ATPase